MWVCTRILTVAFRTRDNWKNMTDAEPHAFGDMWLQFWDCLSFLISGKQEDKRCSFERNEDSDVTSQRGARPPPSLSSSLLSCHLPCEQPHAWAVHTSCASCQIGPRGHNLSFRTLGEGALAPSQGFAGRELEEEWDAEEEVNWQLWLQANWSQPGTPGNPSTNPGTSLGEPQRPTWPQEGPEAADFQKLGRLRACFSVPLCPF